MTDYGSFSVLISSAVMERINSLLRVAPAQEGEKEREFSPKLNPSGRTLCAYRDLAKLEPMAISGYGYPYTADRTNSVSFVSMYI